MMRYFIVNLAIIRVLFLFSSERMIEKVWKEALSRKLVNFYQLSVATIRYVLILLKLSL